jgi:hypothetical protein
MILYHGTSTNNMRSLIQGRRGKIDVRRGGVELGQGFYMGDSLALTKSWAVGRYGSSQACTLKGSIPDARYYGLRILTLSHSAVLNTWQQLRYNGTERNFLFNVDVVYGSLATYAHASQHKFESRQAQGVLNNSRWNVV